MSHHHEISKGQRTRNELIKSAKNLFFTQGYTATGVDQIVAKIGLTSGVFYANFRSKEDLLIHIVSLQIENSKQALFLKKENESNRQWALRVIATYLSTQHRDQLEASCPLSSLSQEMIKLGLDQKTGLAKYLSEFQDILRDRMFDICDGSEDLAPALISLCVGAVQASRLIKDRQASDAFLKDARRVAVRLLLGEGPVKLVTEKSLSII